MDVLAAKEYSEEFNATLDQDVERQDRLPSDDEPDHERPVPTRSKSVPYLDGLRGVAAFLVYMSHHVSWFYDPDDIVQHGFGWHGEKLFGTLPFIRIFLTGGSASVAIFFVLSGYVLSRSPLRMLREGQFRKCYNSLIASTIRRPFRLFIPPAGVSLVMALVMQLPFGLAPIFSWPTAQPSLFAELWNWVIELGYALNPFTKHSPATRWFSYDPPVWTIAVEFQGSILVFASIALFSRPKLQHRVLLFTGTCLALLVLSQWAMACFMAGVIFNDLEEIDEAFWRRFSVRARSIIFHTFFILGWYLLCQTSGNYEQERSYNTWGWYWLTLIVPTTYADGAYWRFWISIGSMLLVYSVLKIQWLQQFFTLSWIRYLGRVSFSLYLTHMPFLWVVGDDIYRFFGQARPEMQTWADNRLTIPDVGPRGLSTRFLISQLFILPLNLLFSEIGTIVLDKPSIQVGKWVVSKIWTSRDDRSGPSYHQLI